MAWARSIKVAFTAVSLLLAAGYVADYPPIIAKKLTSTLALLLLAAWIPWIEGWVLERFQVKTLRFLGVELEAIKNEVMDQREQIEANKRRVEDLAEFMEEDTFDTLRSLQEEKDFTFPSAEGWANDIIRPQLSYLFKLGYIDCPPERFRETSQIGSGRIVTDAGRECIKIRKSIDAERRVPHPWLASGHGWV